MECTRFTALSILVMNNQTLGSHSFIPCGRRYGFTVPVYHNIMYLTVKDYIS